MKYLGSYTTEEEAAEVFQQAAGERNKTKKKNKSSKYIGKPERCSHRGMLLVNGIYRGWCFSGVRLKSKTAAKPWVARICVHGEKKHLGYFAREEEAARAYNKAAKIYHKDRASLNFPESAASNRASRLEEEEDTDDSSNNDDNEEEEMDEEESTSSSTSSDTDSSNGEKGKAPVRSKTRAMVSSKATTSNSSSSIYHEVNKGDESDDSNVVVVHKTAKPAAASFPSLPSSSQRHGAIVRQDKDEDDLKPSAVPAKTVSMTKKSKREEGETGGDSSGRREKKLRAEEGSKGHHSHGDTQDGHREERNAKADGGNGGGGIPLPSSASSSSSGSSSGQPSQPPSTTVQSTTTTQASTLPTLKEV